MWPRCRIAASWEPNAWAYPGGDIFITAGLIGILSDLDSVKLVLGHEIGHVVGRHTTHMMPYMNAFMYTANGIALTTNLAMATFSLGGGFGYLGPVTWLTWFPQTQAVAMGGGVIAGQTLNLMFMGPIAGLMAYSRSNEWQADRFGQQTALATGSDQKAMYDGWGEFMSYLKKYFEIPNGLLAQIFANHPNGDDRMKKIQSRYDQYIEKLAPYQKANRLDSSNYMQYQQIHARYFLGSEAFGNYVMKKRQEQESRANDYSWKSLFSPAGKCIQFALGGVRE
jgi:predicted Zn-dependent protease